MFSDISAWFYKTLAGIMPDPEEPGFKHTIIKPWPVGDLTFAAGETETPYGLLRSSWRKEGERFTLELTIPPNSSATVHIPTTDPDTLLENGHPAHESKAVSFLHITDNRALYHVPAGQYRFQSDLP